MKMGWIKRNLVDKQKLLIEKLNWHGLSSSIVLDCLFCFGDNYYYHENIKQVINEVK